MIFEVPTKHFPMSSDAAKEVKKTAYISPFEKFMRTEMASMNNCLGKTDDGAKSSLFDTIKSTISSSSQVFHSSSGVGLTSALAKNITDMSTDFSALSKLTL